MLLVASARLKTHYVRSASPKDTKIELSSSRNNGFKGAKWFFDFNIYIMMTSIKKAWKRSESIRKKKTYEITV